MKRTMILGAGLILSAAMVAGCDNTREGAERDAEQAAAATERAAERTADAAREAGRDAEAAADRAEDRAEDAADDVADATRNAADKVGDAARDVGAAVADTAKDAGRAVKNAAREAADAGDAAQQTAQIKSALMADDTVDASGIDVDTNGDTKTVTLKGRVKTAAQKTRAARIAADKAPGYRVTNQLTVG